MQALIRTLSTPPLAPDRSGFLGGDPFLLGFPVRSRHQRRPTENPFSPTSLLPPGSRGEASPARLHQSPSRSEGVTTALDKLKAFVYDGSCLHNY